MRSFLTIIIIYFLILSSYAHNTFDQGLVPQLDSMTLNNGLKVYLLRCKTDSVLNVRMVMSGGKKNENECEVGYSQVIQQLLIGALNEKQNSILKTKHVIYSNMIDGQTILSSDCSVNNFDKKMEVFSSTLSRLCFTKEKIDQIVSEIGENYLPDNLSTNKLLDAFQNLLLYTKSDPLGRTYCQYQIQKVTPEQLREFYVVHYTPKTSFLIISGDFDLKKIKHLVAKHFIKWKTLRKELNPIENVEVEALKSKSKEIAFINKTDSKGFTFKWVGPAPLYRSNDNTKFLLACKLFDRFLSKVFIQNGFDQTQLEPISYKNGLMEFTFVSQQNNVTEIIQYVDTAFQNFRKSTFTKTDLDEEVKTLTELHLKMNSSEMISLFYDPLMCNFGLQKNYLTNISAVTTDHIQTMLEKYFDLGSYKLIIVGKEHVVSDQLTQLGNVIRYQSSDFEMCDNACKEVIVIKCHCESCYRRGYCNTWRFDPKDKEAIKNAKAKAKFIVK